MRQTFFELNGLRYDDASYCHLIRVEWQDSPTLFGDLGQQIVWPGFMLFVFQRGGLGENGLGRDEYVFRFSTILAGTHTDKPFLIAHRIVHYDAGYEAVGGGRLNTFGDWYLLVHQTEMDESKKLLLSAAVDWNGGKLRVNSEIP